MAKICKVFLLLLIGGFVIVACSKIDIDQDKATPTPAIPVLSLRENLPRLIEKAQEWDPDAYLVQAVITLEGSEAIDPLYARFHSSNHPYTVCYVEFGVHGGVGAIFDTVTQPTDFHLPIEDGQWKYDSPEALGRFIEDPELLDLVNMGPRACTLLVLERVGFQQQLLWRLSAGPSCFDFDHYYLDPVTGERTGKPDYSPP